jgi:hypothetical protein
MTIMSINLVMNDEKATPRWMKDGAATGPSASERMVLVEVLRAMRALRFGTIGLAVQDGRVVHIEITEKKRL